MHLRPLNDCLIIEPGEQEFTDSNPEIVRILKEGLIKVPEAFEGWFKKSPMCGKIISWGDSCKYKYKVGEKVIFGRFSGAPLNIDNKKLVMLKEDELLAKDEDVRP